MLMTSVFEAGILTESWLVSNILPFYKNKGDKISDNHKTELHWLTVYFCFKTQFILGKL